MGTTSQTCPRCGAFAQLNWSNAARGIFIPAGANRPISHLANPELLEAWTVATCVHCQKVSVWDGNALIWPNQTSAPKVHPELPPDVAADYTEAASIMAASPRGAAALLRLGLEKLCHYLSPGPGKINGAIARLVTGGLQTEVQVALDAVRVIGNEAVHPGQLDLQDNAEIVTVMFDLMNLIAERMISEPRKAREIYARLPKGALEAIEKRDKPKPG